MADMLVARVSFSGTLAGSLFTAVGGQTRVWSDHPAAQRWPENFEPVRVTYENPASAPRVEQATKAPGEKRKR